MTGAGFGGCAIALVKEENIPAFKNNVYDEYMKVVGYAPNFMLHTLEMGQQRSIQKLFMFDKKSTISAKNK